MVKKHKKGEFKMTKAKEKIRGKLIAFRVTSLEFTELTSKVGPRGVSKFIRNAVFKEVRK